MRTYFRSLPCPPYLFTSAFAFAYLSLSSFLSLVFGRLLTSYESNNKTWTSKMEGKKREEAHVHCASKMPVFFF